MRQSTKRYISTLYEPGRRIMVEFTSIGVDVVEGYEGKSVGAVDGPSLGSVVGDGIVGDADGVGG